MSRIAPEAVRDKTRPLAQASFKSAQYKPAIYKFSKVKVDDSTSIASSSPSLDSDFSGTVGNLQKHESNIFNGYRVFSWSNGDEYQGTWKDNQMHGRGTFKCKEGEYQGEFSFHQMQGFGKFKYASGGTYIGEFVGGKREGRGVLSYSEDCAYEGTFLKGEPDGKGTMLYSNGDLYTGEWEGGSQHGAGIYESRHAGVEIFRGYFKGGRRDGRGEIWSIPQVLTAYPCPRIHSRSPSSPSKLARCNPAVLEESAGLMNRIGGRCRGRGLNPIQAG
jgi:hypothetical protein